MLRDMGDCQTLPAGGKDKASQPQEPAPLQWQTLAQVLQVVRNDYSQSRKQLEEICQIFKQKETTLSVQLSYLIDPQRLVCLSQYDELLQWIPASSQSAITLEAYCFGNFQVFVNGKKVNNWHSLKTKSLLEFLIASGRPVPSDVLIDTFWPNSDPETGRNNLKVAIHNLREVLCGSQQRSSPSNPILFREGHYLINPEIELWVDVEQFTRHWLAGRNLEREGRALEATKEYSLAEELYRGDYLEDNRYAEWTLLRREALKDTYLAILAKLSENFFQSKDYESCILYSQKILAVDPCHEEAYRWLIRCHARLGQPYRAQRWYQICAATLKRELDTMPDQQTVLLYEQLFRGETP